MAKQLIKQLDAHAALYRDPATGIAWVENGHAGIAHSAHPNISDTGSVRGMVSRGYWEKGDMTVRSHGFVYNVSWCSTNPDDSYDVAAEAACRCGGQHKTH